VLLQKISLDGRATQASLSTTKSGLGRTADGHIADSEITGERAARLIAFDRAIGSRSRRYRWRAAGRHG